MVLSRRVFSAVLTLLTPCLCASAAVPRPQSPASSLGGRPVLRTDRSNDPLSAGVIARPTIKDEAESGALHRGAPGDAAPQAPATQRRALTDQDQPAAGRGSKAIEPTPREVTEPPAANGKTHAYADVNGLRMYYEVHGTGKPLVVLHGAFGFAYEYPLLAKGRQVIAVELQGHGHTGDIDRPLSFTQMADDTAALLKQLKIERADVFGYSLGGTVAIAMAIRHPDLVGKVAINGAHFSPMETSYEPEMYKGFMSLPDDFAPPVLKDPYDKVAPDPKQWPALVAKIKQLEKEFKGFSREEMQGIRAPFLITLGDRDGVRPEHAVEMFRLIPKSRLAVFPGGDHFLIWTSPGTVLAPIAAFFDDRSTTAK